MDRKTESQTTSINDLHATAHTLGSCNLLALRSKTESLATLVFGSFQNSPALHRTELLMEPVNSHLEDISVMKGGMIQHPKSLQR